jgi:hypothetical protein
MKKKETPEEVSVLGKRLAEWRAGRRRGQRIPEELWAEAAGLARRHGLNIVSNALGLDYYHLKKRSGMNGRNAQPEKEVFAELHAAVSESGGTCVVELEKGNGAKLRVSAGNAGMVDWCQVKEAFLGA